MRTLPHVGEWKVELRADTRDDLFARVAAFIASAAGPAGDPADAWEAVSLSARDPVALLVDWANELIGRSEATGLSYADVRALAVTPPAEAAPADWRLSAEVRGRPVIDWQSPLKAATYHGATLEPATEGWTATLLFDI